MGRRDGRGEVRPRDGRYGVDAGRRRRRPAPSVPPRPPPLPLPREGGACVAVPGVGVGPAAAAMLVDKGEEGERLAELLLQEEVPEGRASEGWG